MDLRKDDGTAIRSERNGRPMREGKLLAGWHRSGGELSAGENRDDARAERRVADRDCGTALDRERAGAANVAV